MSAAPRLKTIVAVKGKSSRAILMFLTTYATRNVDFSQPSVSLGGNDDKRLPILTVYSGQYFQILVESRPISINFIIYLLCINDNRDPATPVAIGTVSGSMRLVNFSLWPSHNNSIKPARYLHDNT